MLCKSSHFIFNVVPFCWVFYKYRRSSNFVSPVLQKKRFLDIYHLYILSKICNQGLLGFWFSEEWISSGFYLVLIVLLYFLAGTWNLHIDLIRFCVILSRKDMGPGLGVGDCVCYGLKGGLLDNTAWRHWKYCYSTKGYMDIGIIVLHFFHCSCFLSYNEGTAVLLRQFRSDSVFS